MLYVGYNNIKSNNFHMSMKNIDIKYCRYLIIINNIVSNSKF